MTYAIVGSGNVGSALATRFARAGVAVGIANTRGPDSLTELVPVQRNTFTAERGRSRSAGRP